VSRAPTTASAVSTFERPNRLKTRDESGVRWVELLEKFRATQERGRRAGRPGQAGGEGGMMPPPVPEKERRALGMGTGEAAALDEQRVGPVGAGRANGQHGAVVPVRQGVSVPTVPQQQTQTQQTHKHKGGLGIGRFASGVAGRRSKR
jgi:vacuole morphology and inheritance protein 14